MSITATMEEPAASGITIQRGAMVLFAFGLLWPLCWLILNRVSLTAFYEESVGYRYFYTLRQLYEPAYLFLPQGQTVNLLFKSVHAALGVLGFPATQIRPRIDYFCIISIAAFQLINIGAFWCLLRQSPRGANAFVAAVFWLLPAYALGPTTGYILLMPDYLAVEPAIVMLSAALLLKVYGDVQWTRTNTVWLAVLLGCALATKVTLAILPGIAVLFLALNSLPRVSSVLSAAATIAAGLLVWGIITCIDVAFVPHSLAYYASGLFDFIRTGGGRDVPPESWLWWIVHRAGDASPITAVVYLAPFLGLAALALARDRKSLTFLGSLLLGAVVYSVILYRRDYYVTLIDSGFYTFMFAWCVWCVALTKRRGISAYARTAVGATVAFLLAILFAQQLFAYVAETLPAIEQSAKTEQELEKLNQGIAGRRLWLVPDNFGRPISLESAIMKGGSSTRGVWLEPDSALIRQAAPDLEFRFERNDSRAINFDDYSAIFFMAKEDLQARERALNERYKIDLFQLECNGVLQMETGTLVICQHRANGAS
jgi:hypothetical protein